MTRAAACLALLPLFAACAAAQPAGARTSAPLELRLARPGGSALLLSGLRGRPVVLFLFATYDSASQLALGHLQRFLDHEPRVKALGIALQPEAEPFLDPYRDALAVDFPLSFDPTGMILAGTTALGRVASVPAFCLLDAHGRLRGVRYGVLTPAQLTEWTSQVLR